MGILADKQGDSVGARRLFEQSLDLKRKLGDRRGAAFSLGNLGILVMKQGDYAEARRLYCESLEIQQELGDRGTIAITLQVCASLAAAEKQWDAVAILWGATERLREEIGVSLSDSERANYAETTGEAQAALGAEPFLAHWSAGHAMTQEQAIAYLMQKA